MKPILRQSWALLALLAPACGLPQSADRPGGLTDRAFDLVYSVELAQASPDTVLWVPVPREDGVQQVEILESPASATISGPDVHGNRFASVTAAQSTRYTWRYRIRRSTDGPGASGGEVRRAYLAADTLVPIDGEAATRAAEASAGRRSTATVSRAIYDRVLADMDYRKDGTGWGTGSTQWACSAGYGNCTDFHALFISMSRSREIPARFTIGFPLPAGQAEGKLNGYHCWAHYYDPAAGWTPVDVSEADKDPSKTDFYYGTLDPDRVSMTVGRDLVLSPPQQGPPLNYFVHAYAERRGEPLDVTTTVRFRDLPR
ncbi:MAG: transglutaminase domain-containing protein [Planctomycetes bacterium]|nr:transglutaminase domain-containing protein [Planctomycetota bacterium]